jgi:hypothetical protein
VIGGFGRRVTKYGLWTMPMEYSARETQRRRWNDFLPVALGCAVPPAAGRYYASACHDAADEDVRNGLLVSTYECEAPHKAVSGTTRLAPAVRREHEVHDLDLRLPAGLRRHGREGDCQAGVVGGGIRGDGRVYGGVQPGLG